MIEITNKQIELCYYFGKDNPTLIGKPVQVLRVEDGRAVVKVLSRGNKEQMRHLNQQSLIKTKPSKYEIRKAKLQTGFYPIKKSDTNQQQANAQF